MAEKTDNYISKFKPESHFFISPEAFSQSDTQSFGPVNSNEFRLTSTFTAGGGTRTAYAICKGIVLVQRQSGSTGLVNLILRPFTQPIPGFNIKYFVYRGLAEADFFNGNKVLAATSSTSGFINQINTSFIDFYNRTAPGQPLPDFLAKYIGFDPATQPDNLPLSDFFFKQSQYVESNGEFVEEGTEAFELPLISMGKSLGNFQAGACGIDVVLNYGDYRLPVPNDEFVFDLAYARASEAKILLSKTMTDYQKKLKKEQLFQFLDAAAFFGFHYSNGSIAVPGSIKQGDAIYNDIVSKFSFKNRLYLYIQSDRGRSYNFYGNYLINDSGSESLKIGDTEDTLTAEAYATNGWPLIIKNNPQSKVYLQLVTDNNENSMLYGQVASIDNAVKNNFIDAEHLKLPDAVDGTLSAFTKSIVLSNASLSIGGNALNVAGFNILFYQGYIYRYITGQETDEQNGTIDVLGQPSFFDDVFDNLQANPLLKANETTEYSIVSSQRLKLVNYYYNNNQLGVSVVQSLNVNDLIETGEVAPATVKRVTYITETVDLLDSAISVTGTITPDTRSNPSIYGSLTENKTYQLPDSFYYSLQLFTDSSQTITGLQLKAKDGSSPTKIILGFTQTEKDLLDALITTNILINVRLFLIDLFEDGTELISTENIAFQKYKAGIVGESMTGELKLYTPATDVIVYSLDRRYHFTYGYSRYVREEILNINGDIYQENIIIV